MASHMNGWDDATPPAEFSNPLIRQIFIDLPAELQAIHVQEKDELRRNTLKVQTFKKFAVRNWLVDDAETVRAADELRCMGQIAGIGDSAASAIVDVAMDEAFEQRMRHQYDDRDSGIGQGPEGLRQTAAPPMAPEPLEVYDAGDDTDLPPPRGWLQGNQFCRKFLSSLVAPGATGKSALRYAQAISQATGKPITGHHIFVRGRVLLLSLEDDIDEMRRRVAAACIYHKIDRTQLKGWLFYSAPKGLKLAEMRDGSPQLGQLEAVLRKEIERIKPDLVMLDPFVKLHALEENDNGAMDFVCDLLAKMAIEYDIGVDAPHHAKKGSATPGDADLGRGGSAIRDAARLVYTLTPMSEEEAKNYAIKMEERRAYIRLDNAKVNLVPGTTPLSWFKLVGVALNNGNSLYPNGDEIQTVMLWDPPQTWAGLSDAVLNVALNAIEAGLPNGQRYSASPNARSRAAWPIVQHHCPDKGEQQCREIVRTWVKNGLLEERNYHDPVDRKETQGLYVNSAKRPGGEVRV